MNPQPHEALPPLLEALKNATPDLHNLQTPDAFALALQHLNTNILTSQDRDALQKNISSLLEQNKYPGETGAKLQELQKALDTQFKLSVLKSTLPAVTSGINAVAGIAAPVLGTAVTAGKAAYNRLPAVDLTVPPNTSPAPSPTPTATPATSRSVSVSTAPSTAPAAPSASSVAPSAPAVSPEPQPTTLESVKIMAQEGLEKVSGAAAWSADKVQEGVKNAGNFYAGEVRKIGADLEKGNKVAAWARATAWGVGGVLGLTLIYKAWQWAREKTKVVQGPDGKETTVPLNVFQRLGRWFGFGALALGLPLGVPAAIHGVQWAKNKYQEAKEKKEAQPSGPDLLNAPTMTEVTAGGRTCKIGQGKIIVREKPLTAKWNNESVELLRIVPEGENLAVTLKAMGMELPGTVEKPQLAELLSGLATADTHTMKVKGFDITFSIA